MNGWMLVGAVKVPLCGRATKEAVAVGIKGLSVIAEVVVAADKVVAVGSIVFVQPYVVSVVKSEVKI